MCFRNGWESQVEMDFSHFETKEERLLSNGALLALSPARNPKSLPSGTQAALRSFCIQVIRAC
jgi:hypothetical protein